MIKLAHPASGDDEVAAVADALRSGQLAQGRRVAAFEQAFAAFVGTRHAVALSSGTAALHVALLAHGVGALSRRGAAADEVIVPAFSFAATANCVLQAGARPVFVDVREDDANIDASAVRDALTQRTRAVIGVHLYGAMCDVAALAAICDEHDIAFVEDAAQAVGASRGGRAAGGTGTGCFSFYATKNLTTGEGGMLTTDDGDLAALARTLRSQGEAQRYVTEELGWNYRMTETAAALGSVQLARLAARNARRRENAARLTALLAGIEGIVLPREPADGEHAWHQYTLRVRDGSPRRDALQAALRARGIESGVFYPLPIHRQPLYVRLGYGGAQAPAAERLCSEVLSIPVHPALTADDVDAVASAVRDFFAGAPDAGR